MKATGFGALLLGGVIGVSLAACQPAETPPPSKKAAAALDAKASQAATTPEAKALEATDLEAPSAVRPESDVEQSSAVASFRRYCYETASDPVKVATLIESDKLQQADDAASGYTKSPQRGARQIYVLPSIEGKNDSLKLVVNNVGVCGVQVSGDAAAEVEADVIQSFSAFRVPAPQSPAVKAGIFIPYGSSISEEAVRKHGLINTMTSTAKGVAVVIYIPPAQAEDVLANARRQ